MSRRRRDAVALSLTDTCDASTNWAEGFAYQSPLGNLGTCGVRYEVTGGTAARKVVSTKLVAFRKPAV